MRLFSYCDGKVRSALLYFTWKKSRTYAASSRAFGNASRLRLLNDSNSARWLTYCTIIAVNWKWNCIEEKSSCCWTSNWRNFIFFSTVPPLFPAGRWWSSHPYLGVCMYGIYILICSASICLIYFLFPDKLEQGGGGGRRRLKSRRTRRISEKVPVRSSASTSEDLSEYILLFYFNFYSTMVTNR